MKERYFKRKILTVTVLTLALMMQSVTPVIAYDANATLDLHDSVVIEQEYNDADVITNSLYAATTETKAEVNFPDMAGFNWAYDAVKVMAEKGFITGYPDGTYKPGGTLTAGEFITMVVKAKGLDPGNASAGKHWSYNYYKAGLDAGFFTAAQIPEKALNSAINRADMANIISHVVTGKVENEAGISSMIKDIGSITKYKQEIISAYGNGILGGYPDGTFKASNTLRRAEAATVLQKIVDPSMRVYPVITAPGEYKVIAEGTNIGDYVKKPETIKSLTDIMTGESNYKVLDNGNKFELKLVKKMDNWFMIEYREPGKVVLLDKDGAGIDRSTPHTTGELVKQPFGVDLSKVKYFVFYEGGGMSYIVPNTLQ